MNRDVRDIYISLLTNSPHKRRVVAIEENTHNACLMKASDIPNANGDVFNIGSDIYATLKVYKVILSSNYLSRDAVAHYLCPNIGSFRDICSWKG